ncbi:MAG: ATP phosphoribosyltransferase, partial [candidate division KSB1 bacterium]|nr:ATP phosphoribosyltransferase [candidate division KSB1 bacterium]
MHKLKLVIPKGRIYANVVRLLNDAGFGVEVNERVYVPRMDDPEIEAKIMKPQNIPRLLELGSHDVGFTGHDWVVETAADIVEIIDLEFDPVKIVAAIPEAYLQTDWQKRKIVVASEYEQIATSYLAKKKYQYLLLRTYGATEVFPPQDADMIIDNVATGRTLKENNLTIIDTILESSTRFYANQAALNDPWKREKIDEMKMIFQAVLDARQRVMLEMNVPKEKLEEIVKFLPCMRSPTVAPLYGDQGYAVKVAVKKREVVKLIPL